MKKKLTLVFIFHVFVSLAFSKTIFRTEGIITNTDSSSDNKPNYRLEINCVNENNAVFRKIVSNLVRNFVPEKSLKSIMLR